MRKKSSFAAGLTDKSLLALLIFSFVCTILGFGIAYNEHRSLVALEKKFDEAIVKIDECQSEISDLSEQIAQAQTITLPSASEDASASGDTIADSQSSVDTTENTKHDSTTQSPPVSGQYYVTQSGSKYHISTCSYLSKSRIAVSAETIKTKGYSPCSRCIK